MNSTGQLKHRYSRWSSLLLTTSCGLMLVLLYSLSRSMATDLSVRDITTRKSFTLWPPSSNERSARSWPAHNPASRRAVVSTIYDNQYALSLQVLGYSLQKAKIQARQVLLYFPDRISNETLCILRAEGWETRPVEVLRSTQEGIPVRYQDQFTKLRLWELHDDFDRILYMDGDTMTTSNFDEVWDMPGDFSATPDFWVDRGMTLDFNAGVLLIRPSQAAFRSLVAQMDTVPWNPEWAEQGFLNEIYRERAFRLPVIYNANLAMRINNVKLWDALRPHFKIVHFTLVKPHWYPNDRHVQDGHEYEDVFRTWWEIRDEMAARNASSICY